MRSVTRSVLLAIAVACLPVAAAAQTPDCPSNEVATLGTVPANSTIRLGWEYPTPAGAVSFSVLVDGQIVKNFAAADLTVVATPGFANCKTYTGAIPGLAAKATPYRVKLRVYVGLDPAAPGFVETAEKDLRVGLPTPFQFRIVVTPQLASNKVVGVDVVMTAEDGTVLASEFAPVAAVTGKISLATPTAIVK